jgi:uncharacterized protein YndB with AHSA1/START domain
MAEPKVVHSTFVVERSFPRPVETVFAALSKPDKVSQWFAEGPGHDLVNFTMDFTEGGRQLLVYRMGAGTPIAGTVITNEARFQEIAPNNRIVIATTMKLGEKRILASQITFELLASEKGTDLVCTHQGAYFEGAHPQMSEMLKEGWNGLFNKLTSVLEGA